MNLRRPLQILAGALATAGALVALAAPATAQTTDPQPPAGTVLVRSESARGYQIYSCNSSGALQFSRPYAGLSGKIIHWGPGPFWETYDQPYSRIRGAATGTFPNPDPQQNIPDLTLTVTETVGTGPLAGITDIIRRNSTGGGPTRAGQPCQVGSADVWVDYRATYEFYERR